MFQLQVLHASEDDVQPKMLHVTSKNGTATTANNLSAPGTSTENQKQTSDNETGLESNFARLKLLHLYKASKNELTSNSVKSSEQDSEEHDSSFKANDPLKLTGLPAECLQLIIRKLPFRDFMNVAGASTRLQEMARAIFKLIVNEVTIDFGLYPTFKVKSTQFPATSRFYKDFPEFFVTFGKLITTLTINNMKMMTSYDEEQTKCNEELMKFVAKNCAEGLKVIKFNRCGEEILKHCQPFKAVEQVTFQNCSLGRLESDFGRFFPEMKRLELNDCNVMFFRDCIAKPFPLLQSLIVNAPLDAISFSNLSFVEENIRAAIDLNPQIKDFGICYWNEVVYDANLLIHAAANLPNLKCLQLSHWRYTDFRSDYPIMYNEVERFVLFNRWKDFGRLNRNLSSLIFPKLKTFIFVDLFDTECFAFLSRHKTITKFSFGSESKYNNPTDDDILELANILPNLEKIELNGNSLTSNGLKRFITRSKSVSKIIVRNYYLPIRFRKLFPIPFKDLGWMTVYNTSKQKLIMKRLSK